jgi:Ig-like domain from next to BRCA1 gene
MKFKSNRFLITNILFTLILTSCGSSNNSIIATSVALTVQAQGTQPVPTTEATQAAEATGTTTPLATSIPLPETFTPVPTVISPTASPTFTSLNCSIVANFVSEDPPDGTIESPDAQFTKTWNVQNNGTCTWDTSWKIAYDKGDLLGAGYVYNFPQTVAPGQTVPISLVLTAPAAEGVYTGYWLLGAPNGNVFGVGQYSVPLSVKINVNSGTAGPYTPTVYGITSITYDYSTAFGKSGMCSPNVFLTTYATISVSGPLKITYYWAASDGGNGVHQTLTFTDASSVTIHDTWPLSVGHEIGLKWEEIVVTSPIHQAFVNTYARYDHECQ